MGSNMIRMSEEQFVECKEESTAVCIFCDEQYDGVDCSAHREKCERCGRHGVCGIDDLIVSNRIEIVAHHQIDEPRFVTKTEKMVSKLREEWRNKPK